MSRPHTFYKVEKKSAEITGTGTVIWDPADNKRFILTDLILNVTAAATVTIFDETDSTARLDLRIFKGDLAAKQTEKFTFESSGFPSDAQNNILRGTTTAGTLYVTAIGYEDN